MNSAVYIIRGNQRTIPASRFCLGFPQIRNELCCEFGVREQNTSHRPLYFVKVEQSLSNAVLYTYAHTYQAYLMFIGACIILIVE